MSDEPTTDSHSEVPLITEGLERIGNFKRFSHGLEITVATHEERISGRVAAAGDDDPFAYVAVDEYKGDPTPRIGAVNGVDKPDLETDRISEVVLKAVPEGNSYYVMATTVNSDGRIVSWPFGRIAERTTQPVLDPETDQ